MCGGEASSALRLCLIGSDCLTQLRGRFIWPVALPAEDVALTARPLVVLWGEHRLAPWVPPSSEALAVLASSPFLAVTTRRRVTTTTPHQWTATHLSTLTTPVIVKPSRQFHTLTTTSTRRLPNCSKTNSTRSNMGVTRRSDVRGFNQGQGLILQSDIVQVPSNTNNRRLLRT